MEAEQYLNNLLVLENCKEYLKALEFLPIYKGLLKKVDDFNVEDKYSNFSQFIQSNGNETSLSFGFMDSKGGILIHDIELAMFMGSNVFFIEFILKDEKIDSVKINYNDNPLSEREIKINFLNNEVCKINEFYKKNGSRKRKESYYIKGEMIASSVYDYRWSELEMRMCVEKALNPECGYWYHDTLYERDYYNDTCYMQKYREKAEILSHNQFDKKYNGVLKRVKRLGTEN